MAKPDYDTSIARMAGNIASGLVIHFKNSDFRYASDRLFVAQYAVDIARNIVAELRAQAAAPEPTIDD